MPDFLLAHKQSRPGLPDGKLKILVGFWERVYQGVRLPSLSWKPEGITGRGAELLLSRNRRNLNGKVTAVCVTSAASACQPGQLCVHNFLRVEIPEFAEAECSGSGGMRVINCLNCAPVFAFRQIPPPNRAPSLACQQVVVTTC